ncbi:MAG: hypothetical protein KGL39_55260 [Patescibacteria group bacterium]|nr:hypothetical protein [Patescibacteria group bacterium]
MLAALRHFKSLTPLPTNLGSADLRELMQGVDRKSVFSARTNLIDYVNDIKDAIARMMTGDTNLATAKMELLEKLRAYGYTPGEGFPQAPDANIPPAEEGSLRDLSSDPRLNLVVTTNFRQALNWQMQQDGLAADALEQFPAWELIRIYPRMIPRGERRGPKGTIIPVPGDDWPSRFEAALAGTGDTDAARVFSATGQMMARKDSPVWEYLGDPANFADAIGTDYPPFAFNSGMGWMPVRRAECLLLGLIRPQDMVVPSARAPFGAELSADEATADLADLRAARGELEQLAQSWRRA